MLCKKNNRKTTYFQTPGEFATGCELYRSSAYWELNFKKSTVSATASISACQAFLPCPNIVAANISYLYFPEIKSAAFRKTDARSEKGNVDHVALSFNAAVMASLTCSVVACEHKARVVA